MQPTWPPVVPSHWEVKPLRRVFEIISGSTPRSGEPNYWNGAIMWATPDDLGDLREDTLWTTRRTITEEGYRSCGTWLAPAGSLVLSTRAPIGHVAIAGVPVCTNQGCRALVMRNADSERFLYYQLVAARPELESWGQGSTFKELSRDGLAAVRFAIPPLDEQWAIARFLDRETARIDALIERKQRQTELLHEKRAALISHAVTKGLDPSAPTKDSGIDWLGEVPIQWEHRKIGYLVSAEGGCTPSKSNSDYWIGEIPWVSPKDMKQRVVSDSEDHVSEQAVRESGLHLIDPPVVLVVVRGMILAHTFPVAVTTVPVTINQDMKALRPKPGCTAEYLMYLLEGMSSLILSVVDESAHGTKCLRTEIWKSIGVFVPAAAEQTQVCAVLRRRSAGIDRLIDQIRLSIDRLREYRTALVSAAVAGKIDVSQEAA